MKDEETTVQPQRLRIPSLTSPPWPCSPASCTSLSTSSPRRRCHTVCEKVIPPSLICVCILRSRPMRGRSGWPRLWGLDCMRRLGSHVQRTNNRIETICTHIHHNSTSKIHTNTKPPGQVEPASSTSSRSMPPTSTPMVPWVTPSKPRMGSSGRANQSSLLPHGPVQLYMSPGPSQA